MRKYERVRGLGGDSSEVVIARGPKWSREGLRTYFDIVGDIVSVENLIFNVEYWYDKMINNYLEEAGIDVRVYVDLWDGEVTIHARDLDNLESTRNGLVHFLNELHVAQAKFLQILLEKNIERARRWFWIGDLRAAKAQCDAANAAAGGQEDCWQVCPTFTVQPIPPRKSRGWVPS